MDKHKRLDGNWEIHMISARQTGKTTLMEDVMKLAFKKMGDYPVSGWYKNGIKKTDFVWKTMKI